MWSRWIPAHFLVVWIVGNWRKGRLSIMIHMESGLGELLGKPIMNSIIGKNWSVMGIYKWSRYSIRRYIQREICLGSWYTSLIPKWLESFGSGDLSRIGLQRSRFSWSITEIQTIQLYPCRNRLLHSLRELVLDDSFAKQILGTW